MVELTSNQDALTAVGKLCEKLAEQDSEPQVRWDFTAVIPAGTISLTIALDKVVTPRDRDLLFQAAIRIASLTKER